MIPERLRHVKPSAAGAGSIDGPALKDAALTPKRLLLVASSALLVALVGAGAYWRFGRPVPVVVAPVAIASVPVRVVGPGTVQARIPVALSARITSTVVEVTVDVGDAVRPGQPLVALDDRDLVARQAAVRSQQASLARQVDAAAAAVAKARADLDLTRAKQRRDAELHRKGFVSQASLDTSNAGANAAEAALDGAEATLAARRADRVTLEQEARLAQTQLGYARLVAPMAGVVTHRLVEPGTTVAPGTPILRLVDPDSLWVATRVDESVVGRVAVGQRASIRLRSGDTVDGRVARIALQSDAATRELDVHVAFDQPPARVAIDQEAEVRIDTGSVEGLTIPASAIIQDRDGRRGVLRVVDGRSGFALVDSGASAEGRVIVTRGLAAGELVLADPRGVKAGMRVEATVSPGGPGR